MIGIFDSGSGGLTVLRAIREVLPSCDVLYFGDIQNAPYGSKSSEELSLLTTKALIFLKERGAQRIVSACNSVSASLALSLFDVFDLDSTQVIEMIGPTVAYFKGFSGRVLLCATPATVRSNSYQNAFRMIGKDITTISISELAGAIEFGQSESDIEEIITNAFENVVWQEGDVLVLACTHYPLVLSLFRKIIPPFVLIFDPAEAVAERVKKQFWPQEVRDGTTHFVISKDSEQFRTLVSKIFSDINYEIEVLALPLVH
ncbi:aspartate/glutamate racemase family protein [Acetobacteraceae bacterium]|nr:aspartate/glutamate racemase family protein [Candidatus Parcubacteria bacterium]